MEKELVLERYSDIAYIDGVYRCDSKMERAMHKLCRKYYDDNFHKQEVGEEGRKDIFQSSLLALWENIRNRRLYVEDGELKGRDGQAFTSSLTTYFMGIVNNKYMEWLRKNPIVPAIDPKKERFQTITMKKKSYVTFCMTMLLLQNCPSFRTASAIWQNGVI